MQFSQENIYGYKLHFVISNYVCDKGQCEEYVAQSDNVSLTGHWLTLPLVFVALSLIVSFVFHWTNALCIFLSVVVTGLLILKNMFQVIAEKVLYIPNVGLQQTTCYACGLQSPLFIPCSNIADILINEDINWTHSFYLAVVLKDSDPLHPLVKLFSGTSPRLPFLQKILLRVHNLQKSTARSS